MAHDIMLTFPDDRPVGRLHRFDHHGNMHFVGPMQGRVVADRRYFHGAVVEPDWIHRLIPLGPAGLLALTFAKPGDVRDAHLADVAFFSGLRGLHMARCGRVTDRGLRHLANLWSLAVLDLSLTELTDEGLAMIGELVALRHLDLGGTHIVGPGIAHLARLHKLKWLSLEGTAVDDLSVAPLATLPSLASLTVRGGFVTGEGVTLLRRARPELVIHGARKAAGQGAEEALARTVLVALVHRLEPAHPVTIRSGSRAVSSAINEVVPRFSTLEVPIRADVRYEFVVPHMDGGLGNASDITRGLVSAPPAATLTLRTIGRSGRDVRWFVTRGPERRKADRPEPVRRRPGDPFAPQSDRSSS